MLSVAARRYAKALADVVATDSQLNPAEVVSQLRAIEASRQIKNAKLELLDHCGHFPWLEQPERTWKVVDEFLAALDGMK